jgi:hypothetical protein
MRSPTVNMALSAWRLRSLPAMPVNQVVVWSICKNDSVYPGDTLVSTITVDS